MPHNPDFISRLLNHPSPQERSLALKLNGVEPKHLYQAIDSGDIHLATQAINHPSVDATVLTHLMENNNPALMPLRQAALQHPAIEPHHHQAYQKAYFQHNLNQFLGKSLSVKDVNQYGLTHPDNDDAPLEEVQIAPEEVLRNSVK